MNIQYAIAGGKVYILEANPRASRTVPLVTVPEWAMDKVADAVRKLTELGFKVYATRGTKEFLDGAGVSSELVLELQEGRPNTVDAIENRKIQLVFNVPVGRKGKDG
ncbi:MAG: hypothetical protein KAS74_03715 [Methanosarcinales archaeon]|nr:hypothetical protein [Methanosarcinales archaeon]